MFSLDVVIRKDKMSMRRIKNLKQRANIPHLIDFDGLEHDPFVLQHTTYGSRTFCEKFNLNADHDGCDYEW